MKAMILAAGLGTRLRPLTLTKPKALVPIGNLPVIDRLLAHLKQQGIRRIIVNAHHHAQQLVEHLREGRPFDMDIQVREEPTILGTGGGIKNTQDFWDDDPFVVINADILTDVDISKAVQDHVRRKSLATLVVHDCEPFNQIRTDDDQNVVEIGSEHHASRLAFTGIHILDPRILQHIPSKGFSNIIDCYRRLIDSGSPIRAHPASGHYWRDIGTLESYVQANRESLHGNRLLIGPGCRIHPTAGTREWAVIGANARLEQGVEIRRSILWNDVRVKKGIRIVDSVVTSQREVTQDLVNEIY